MLVRTPSAARAANLSIVVNNIQDLPDANPGDGFCNVFEAPFLCTLRAAIMEANHRDGDDTIMVPAGEYVLNLPGPGEDGATGGDLDITVFSSVTIMGDRRFGTTIDGGGLDRVFHVHSFATLRLSRVAIINGDAGTEDGGGIFNGGTLVLEETTVTSSRANNGGGIYNRAGASAPIFLPAAPASLEHGEASGNVATSGGGGIWNGGTLRTEGFRTKFNSAGSNGGGIWNDGALDVVDSTVSSNIAGARGGGIQNTGTTTLRNSEVSDNAAGPNASGGVVASLGADASLTLIASTVSGNQTGNNGGGLVLQGFALVEASTIHGNTATIGGGVYTPPTGR